MAKDRRWERSYRGRWAHDKVVRSTHGVNCTGSCSWNVYVKDGLITWEAQAVDYPPTEAGMPDHEPRGCPRGASFSWYTYSPTRLKYPYVRGSLLQMFRDARARLGDPVEAWAEIVEDVGGWLSDRIGAGRVLRICFVGTLILAVGLAIAYKHIVPLTVCCLTVAVALGLGTGAVFKLVPHWFPDEVGAVTGVVGAAGGLGGFFPPLVMALVKSLTGSYTLGFVLLAIVAAACLIVLQSVDRPRARPKRSILTPPGPAATPR